MYGMYGTTITSTSAARYAVTHPFAAARYYAPRYYAPRYYAPRASWRAYIPGFGRGRYTYSPLDDWYKGKPGVEAGTPVAATDAAAEDTSGGVSPLLLLGGLALAGVAGFALYKAAKKK